MTTRDRGLRGTRHVTIVYPPERVAADTRLALIWRAQFRAEKANSPTPTTTTDVATRAKTGGTERQRRMEFAKGIARLELGRAYWDEKLNGDAANKRSGPVRAAAKISARNTER
jgi:hypothetical protein